MVNERFSFLFLPLLGQKKIDIRNSWGWRWWRLGDCGCDGDCLPGWGGGDLHGAGDCGCDSLNLNLRVQDMGWYSLAVEVDPYFLRQDHSDCGDKAGGVKDGGYGWCWSYQDAGQSDANLTMIILLT